MCSFPHCTLAFLLVFVLIASNTSAPPPKKKIKNSFLLMTRGWDIPRVDHAKVKGASVIHSAIKKKCEWDTNIDTQQAPVEGPNSFKRDKRTDITKLYMTYLLTTEEPTG